jgi:hypothetical protein
MPRLVRHPEVRAQRASKGDGHVASAASFVRAAPGSIVIPEAAKRLSGIHNLRPSKACEARGYGFRARALRPHPGMTGLWKR